MVSLPVLDDLAGTWSVLSTLLVFVQFLVGQAKRTEREKRARPLSFSPVHPPSPPPVVQTTHPGRLFRPVPCVHQVDDHRPPVRSHHLTSRESPERQGTGGSIGANHQVHLKVVGAGKRDGQDHVPRSPEHCVPFGQDFRRPGVTDSPARQQHTQPFGMFPGLYEDRDPQPTRLLLDPLSLWFVAEQAESLENRQVPALQAVREFGDELVTLMVAPDELALLFQRPPGYRPPDTGWNEAELDGDRGTPPRRFKEDGAED
ncbi:MAG: hypothetical protein ABSH20_11685 [Tepidisphaeraceae bacterium]|jgi:hypothetical protein